MKRLLIASLATNLVLGLVAIGWIAWIVASPEDWFPGAYAEKGERGDKGPRGPVGPEGPPGPVGPDAEEAVSAVEFNLSELTTKAEEIEADLESLSSMAGFSELESKVEELDTAITELNTTITDICDGVGSTRYTIGSELDDLISNMYAGCP